MVLTGVFAPGQRLSLIDSCDPAANCGKRVARVQPGRRREISFNYSHSDDVCTPPPDCFMMETFLHEKSGLDALEYVALSFHFKSTQKHPNLE